MNNCRDLSKNFDATREEQEKTRGAEGGKLWGKVAAQFFLKLCGNVAAKCLLKIAQKSCGEIFAQNCVKRHGLVFAQNYAKKLLYNFCSKLHGKR